MLATLIRFLADKRGATAVEYGLILVVLSLVVVSGIQGFGDSMENMFARVGVELDASWN